MAKRLGPVRAKPGQIRLKYGSIEGQRDYVAAHGDGVPRGDSYLLFEVLEMLRKPRPPHLLSDHPDRPTPSMMEELKSRGFDLETLEITIRKPDVG